MLLAGLVAGLVTMATLVRPASVESPLSVRLAQLALAASAAYLLDDASAELTRVAPTPMWRHRAFALVVGLSVVASAWLVVLLNLRRVTDISVPALTLEAVVMTIASLAASAVVARRGEPEPGNMVAVVLPLTGIAALLGGGMLDVDVFVQSQGPAQSESGTVWLLVGVLGLIVLAMASRGRPA